jgi:hypothetical protein
MPWGWEDDDSRMKWCEHGMYIFAGILFGVLLTMGIVNMTGYTSLVFEWEPNGTISTLNPGHSDGVVMVVAAALLFPLCIVVMRLLKLERRQNQAGI